MLILVQHSGKLKRTRLEAGPVGHWRSKRTMFTWQQSHYVSGNGGREYRLFFQGITVVEGRNAQLDEKAQEVGSKEGELTVLIF